MRMLALLLAASLPLAAEFLRVDVTFEDIGCASCIESLEGRLSRVRGVERVEIDPERGVAAVHLAPKNQARLTPLLSRITQDGTKILRVDAVALGTITSKPAGLVFQPTGLSQTFLLELQEVARETKLNSDMTYQVTGTIEDSGPQADAVISANSVTVATEN